MADTASLIVRVKTEGVTSADKSLSSMTKSAVKAAAAAVSVGAAYAKLVSTQRNFDKLNAGLITMTGSADKASQAFAQLQQFAASTPYSLDQSVAGFTKLVALGLDPSEKSLRSFGNTAAAMGKDLNQMIEAVADASTGEFERLKEFGIRASQQGNQVSFTFRGVTTTVAKNSKDIQQYLVAIGENDFAGAMANRMATLDGAMSNADDSFNNFVLSISRSGVGDLIAAQVNKSTASLNDLTDMISSGQAIGYINAWGSQWESTADDIQQAISSLGDFIAGELQNWGSEATSTGEFFTSAFTQFPANIRAAIQIATVEVAGFVDKLGAYGKAAAEALNPFGDDNWRNELDSELEQISRNVLSTTSGFLEQRDAAIKSTNDQIDASKKLRQEYEEQKKQRTDLASLVPSRSGGQNAPTESAASKKFLDQLKKANMSELELVQANEQEKLATLQGFRDQNMISEQQFEQAKTDIALNGLAQREKLASDAAAKRIEDQQRYNQQELDLRMQYMSEFSNIGSDQFSNLEEDNNNRLDALKSFYDNGIILEDEYQKKRKQLNDQYGLDRAKATGNEFGKMASDIGAAFGEASGAYKAFAITQASIATYTSAIEAYKSAAAIPVVGYVLGPIAAAAAVAAGLANIAKIKSAREQGGSLARGQTSLIAERGLEVITPASNSRVRTAQQMQQIMGENKQNSYSSPIIINQTTGRIDQVDQSQDNEGRLILTIREIVSQDLLDSNSDISKSRVGSRGLAGF